jgi:hypothetical protein
MKWRRNRSSCSIIARSRGWKITPTLRSFFAQHIALQEIDRRQKQPAGDFIEARRAFENLAAVALMERPQWK